MGLLKPTRGSGGSLKSFHWRAGDGMNPTYTDGIVFYPILLEHSSYTSIEQCILTPTSVIHMSPTSNAINKFSFLLCSENIDDFDKIVNLHISSSNCLTVLESSFKHYKGESLTYFTKENKTYYSKLLRIDYMFVTLKSPAYFIREITILYQD